MAFSLHTRLAAGEFEVGRIRGCRLHLKNNALFPWFLLVPEVEQRIEDLHQLESGGYDEVMAAYNHAVQSGYRFFSYGDAMILI